MIEQSARQDRTERYIAAKKQAFAIAKDFRESKFQFTGTTVRAMLDPILDEVERLCEFNKVFPTASREQRCGAASERWFAISRAYRARGEQWGHAAIDETLHAILDPTLDELDQLSWAGR